MPVSTLHDLPFPRGAGAVLAIVLLALPAPIPAHAEEPPPAEGYVAYPCPIEGQAGAVVLAHGGAFQAACVALSPPTSPGPWNAADQEVVDGSSGFCPRLVTSVLDRSGAITIRFLPADPGSLLADPARCCRVAAIDVEPQSGTVRVSAAGAAADCFGGGDDAGARDFYRWDGTELVFLESRRTDPGPAE